MATRPPVNDADADAHAACAAASVAEPVIHALVAAKVDPVTPMRPIHCEVVEYTPTDVTPALAKYASSPCITASSFANAALVGPLVVRIVSQALPDSTSSHQRAWAAAADGDGVPICVSATTALSNEPRAAFQP